MSRASFWNKVLRHVGITPRDETLDFAARTAMRLDSLQSRYNTLDTRLQHLTDRLEATENALAKLLMTYAYERDNPGKRAPRVEVSNLNGRITATLKF